MKGGVEKNMKVVQIDFRCLPWAWEGSDGDNDGIFEPGLSPLFVLATLIK